MLSSTSTLAGGLTKHDRDYSEEIRLLTLAQAGDKGALRCLFEKLSGVLYHAVLLPRVDNPFDAQTLLGDTL